MTKKFRTKNVLFRNLTDPSSGPLAGCPSTRCIANVNVFINTQLVFNPLKKYMSTEIGKIVGMDIAHLTKAEWLGGYVKACNSEFTIYNIHGSWDGADLESFNSRKVIRRVQSKTPSSFSFSTSLVISWMIHFNR